MASVALKQLRALQNTQANDDDVRVDMDFTRIDDGNGSGTGPVVNVDPVQTGHGDGEPRVQKKRTPKKKKNKRVRVEESSGESGLNLYDSNVDLDTPELDHILYNPFMKSVHEDVPNVQGLWDIERQCLQHAAYIRHLRLDVIPVAEQVSSDLENRTAERDKDLEDLKSAQDALDLEMSASKKYKGFYKTVKDKNKTLEAEVERLKADLEKLRMAPPASGMSDEAVGELIKKNLQRAQAKFNEEKASLVKLSREISSASFENAVAQLGVLNPGLKTEGTSSKHEVFEGKICRVNMGKKVYVDVASGEEVGPYVE